MLKPFVLIFAALGAMEAQQVVAPTPEQVGSSRGGTFSNYNITQSFETGYRFHQIGGNVGEYRSDVNYGNGLRLLGSSLTVNSKEGHGGFFDEILLNTSGLGNDPYQSAMLRIQKNGLYRYDMNWRLSDYFNPGLTVAGGNHLMDTSRRLQDHDLTLLPQSPVQLHLGYSRNTEDGPALSTVQEFVTAGAGYPIFTNVRRQWNEYRVGADLDFAGFKFSVLRRWDFYKDDTPATLNGVAGSGSASDLTVLQSFSRTAPLHGSSPGWLGNLFTKRKYWGVNARISYVNGRGDFALNESAAGIGQSGKVADRQIAVVGEATRPEVVGDLNLSLFPTGRMTITNNSSVTNNRINGESTYSEVAGGFPLGTTINFRYLAVRTVANSTELNYRLTDWLAFYAGYHFTDRRVRTVEGFNIPALANSFGSNLYDVFNRQNAGTFGLRIRPVKPLTITLDGELGHSDYPLTPGSAGKYHTIGGKASYRARKVHLSASFHEHYNSTAPFSFLLSSSHSRSYSANGSWTPKDWFSVDASYNKLHLDSLSFLAFFAGVNRPQLQSNDSSLYLSNIHAGNLGVRLGITKRANVYVGYSITKDTGDGRATAVPAGVTDPILALLGGVQTFPLTYQSPLVRLSMKISAKVRWNAGWQYYDYGQQFQVFSYNQNFHAHTGYTSLLWAF